MQSGIVSRIENKIDLVIHPKIPSSLMIAASFFELAQLWDKYESLVQQAAVLIHRQSLLEYFSD